MFIATLEYVEIDWVGHDEKMKVIHHALIFIQHSKGYLTWFILSAIIINYQRFTQYILGYYVSKILYCLNDRCLLQIP